MAERDEIRRYLDEKWREFSKWLKTSRHYILDENRQPVACEDMREAMRWWEGADIHVADTYLTGDIRVSTVFLGLNHNYGSGPPLLFETAVFRPDVEVMNRYETWEETEFGHQMIVEDLIKNEGREIVEEDPLNAEVIE